MRVLALPMDGLFECPYEIRSFFPTETPEVVRRLMAAFALGSRLSGTGIANPKGGAQDDPLSPLYELVDVGYTDRLRQHSAATHGPFDRARHLTRGDCCPRFTIIGKDGVDRSDHLKWTGIGRLRGFEAGLKPPFMGRLASSLLLITRR